MALLHVVAAALVLTALNAIKPVHLDDPVYLSYAAEFAAHPLNPYAFHIGSPFLVPANDVLVPPVLPYWLGLGIALFGDHPVLLKCWLFPFVMALAWAVDFLAARVAPSLRAPLLWLCLLSPTVLPGFNFMLEVPVLALGLTALAVAMRSVERESWSLALLAGLLAALAIQTKYTGIIACTAIVVWCILRGRWARGAAVAALALALVVGWECLVASAQGQSHFLVHLRQRQGQPVQRCLHLLLPLVGQLAGLAPAVALLGLTALGWTGRHVLIVGLSMLGAVTVLALVPSRVVLLTWTNGKTLLTPSNLVYGWLAVPVWTALVGVCLRLARRRTADGPARLLDWFLLAWLGLELAGYFALSPFPAARRVSGLLLVFTLMVGRLAHLRGVLPRIAGRLAVVGTALSLLFFATDLLDARAARVAAGEVARRPYFQARGSTFWHLSWYGFAYYADREGLRPLQLNREMPRQGDLLAMHDVREFREALAHHPEIGLELIDTVAAGDCFPLRVAPEYYCLRTPLENQRAPRIRVRIYRITTVSHETPVSGKLQARMGQPTKS
jgi:hypothetical protein